MLIKDYKDDKNWSTCGDELNTLGLAPNHFVTVILSHKDNIADIENINTAIETGTFHAYTTRYFAEIFDNVITIEQLIDNHRNDIYKKIHDDCPNIEFYHGSSEQALPDILKSMPDERLLFLLDAHHGGITPITAELKAIKEHSNRNDHVIIIDDCDELGQQQWPKEEEFINMLRDINKDYNIVNTKIGKDIYIAYESKA